MVIEGYSPTRLEKQFEMWSRPNTEINNLYNIWQYALTIDGYQYSVDQWSVHCGDLANNRLAIFGETGRWEGSFEELRCCLFFEQRRWHHFCETPTGNDLKAIQSLYQTIVNLRNLERR